jgi:2-polyprenyl-6-methoxyphenol hydroxylase-like FAD-dependent oxidoreductase
MMEPRILIVGAGPVGLTAACDLRLRGQRVEVVDQSAGPSAHSKAIGVMPRTLEMLDRLGVGQRMVDEGLQLRAFQLHGVARMELPPVDSPYPGPLSLPQDVTERILGERLRALGGDIRWRTRCAGVNDLGDRVRVTLIGPDGASRPEEVDWVIGCDGAHSTVRKALGIEFAGERSAEWWALTDGKVDGEVARHEPTAFLSPDGPMLLFPLSSGRHRVFVQLPRQPPEDRPEPEPADFERWLAERAGLRIHLRDVVWSSTFQISRRIVSSYRSGRAFLAGDAAHIHSPVGARGMNTGIQDALNLTWKLALVCEGRAALSLLDTYEAERLPIGRATLRQTRLATSLVTLQHRAAVWLRNRAIRLALESDSLRRRLARFLSMTGISYPAGAIVEGPRRSPEGPAPGERAPDALLVDDGGRACRAFELFRSTRYVLLVFDAPAAREPLRALCRRHAQVLECHVVREQAEAGASCRYEPAGASELYLIRPDGYVGYRGSAADLAPLEAHLDRTLL